MSAEYDDVEDFFRIARTSFLITLNDLRELQWDNKQDSATNCAVSGLFSKVLLIC